MFKPLVNVKKSVLKPKPAACDCVKKIVDECLDSCAPKTPVRAAVEEAVK